MLDLLPRDVLLLICEMLLTKSLRNLAICCRRLNTITHEMRIWRRVDLYVRKTGYRFREVRDLITWTRKYSAIRKIAASGDVGFCKLAIVNEISLYGFSKSSILNNMLAGAALRGDQTLVYSILAIGANDYLFAAYSAASGGHNDMLYLMLNMHGMVTAQNIRTCCIKAINNGHYNTVRFLLTTCRRGDIDYDTLINIACRQRTSDIVRLLLEMSGKSLNHSQIIALDDVSYMQPSIPGLYERAVIGRSWNIVKWYMLENNIPTATHDKITSEVYLMIDQRLCEYFKSRTLPRNWEHTRYVAGRQWGIKLPCRVKFRYIFQHYMWRIYGI
jgi:hypothetical protein